MISGNFYTTTETKKRKIEDVLFFRTIHKPLQPPFFEVYFSEKFDIEIGVNKKIVFQNVLQVRFIVSVIWASYWTEKGLSELLISILGKKNSENAVFCWT